VVQRSAHESLQKTSRTSEHLVDSVDAPGSREFVGVTSWTSGKLQIFRMQCNRNPDTGITILAAVGLGVAKPLKQFTVRPAQFSSALEAFQRVHYVTGRLSVYIR
jgi:hypothetical protein